MHEPAEGRHPTPQKSWTPREYWIVYVIAVLTILLILRLMQITRKYYKIWKSNRKFYPNDSMQVVSTDIFLRLWNGPQQVILLIDQLSVPQHYLTLQNPSLHDNNPVPTITWDSDIFGSRLTIDWHDTCLTHMEANMDIPLPETVKVPRSLRYLVRSIMRNTYFVTLILKTGPEQQNLPVFYIRKENGREIPWTPGSGRNMTGSPPPKRPRKSKATPPKPARPHPRARQVPPRQSNDPIYVCMDGSPSTPKRTKKRKAPVSPVPTPLSEIISTVYGDVQAMRQGNLDRQAELRSDHVNSPPQLEPDSPSDSVMDELD